MRSPAANPNPALHNPLRKFAALANLRGGGAGIVQNLSKLLALLTSKHFYEASEFWSNHRVESLLIFPSLISESERFLCAFSLYFPGILPIDLLDRHGRRLIGRSGLRRGCRIRRGNFSTRSISNMRSHGSGIDFTGPKARGVFDPSLIALFHADQKALGPDEVGVLDGDPICSCQDWDGIWNLKIDLQPLSDGRAKAAVSFALFAPQAGTDQDRRSLEMTLVSVGWPMAHLGHPGQIGPEGSV